MQGQCLCGAIQVSTETQTDAGLCHCRMCRRWTSGPLHAVHCSGPVTFSGDTPRRYRSSEWAERGFCATCGTHLFYYLRPNDEYILSAGLFPETSFTLRQEVFIEEKPDYYAAQEHTEKMTGAEVYAKYGHY
ncbi:GFA family protein [Gilvimarinus agarilyticus]|uniref:GFA family protein n=1 Tax=unclassified Gilvimarinus TaxID=2642066 RepID=UPI001C08350B|nr:MULTISPECIES: GFA family protein [unclassified Gilvimarinus]MBU2884250.1 GFA family protein [Gilvimarinus agarilyticus]MDO6569389.1 GFA family protein [Gilvimarinus sp. 2_MG-2023]MDO6747543.1 GFA family protein [Gilvimarinus sp. 1_MG-2023]